MVMGVGGWCGTLLRGDVVGVMGALFGEDGG